MADDKHIWLDKYHVLHPDHINDLEQDAAIGEFEHRKPREEAESHAYDTYKRKQHVKAAAYHLQGQKAANAIGDKEEAAKHGHMYEQHLKQAGFSQIGPTPPEVKELIDDSKVDQSYKFKPHKADVLINNKEDDMSDKVNKSVQETTIDSALSDLTKNVVKPLIKQAVYDKFIEKLIKAADDSLVSAGKHIGSKVKTLREQRGISESDLARACGMDVSNYARFERGEHRPRVDTMMRIAHALKIPMQSLFDKQD